MERLIKILMVLIMLAMFIGIMLLVLAGVYALAVWVARTGVA